MACIEARGLRKAYGTTRRARRRRPRRRGRPHRRPDRPQRRRQDHRAKAILGLTPYRGRADGARPRPVDRARPADARRLLHRRRRRAAALDARVAGARLRRRRASALRPREGRGASSPRPTSSATSRCASCPRAWSRSCTWRWSWRSTRKLLVLDEPTLGLDILYRKQFYDTLLNDYFDEQPHHRRHHPPGRGGRAHPHRRDVHRPTAGSCSTAAWRSSRRATPR